MLPGISVSLRSERNHSTAREGYFAVYKEAQCETQHQEYWTQPREEVS